MRSPNALLLAICLSAAIPACAQTTFPFQITLIQGPNTVNIVNGSVVTLTSPAPGQKATATIELTYLGKSTVVFNTAPQILGSTAFTVVTSDTFPRTLAPQDKLTFDIKYVAQQPVGTTPSSAQLNFSYVETGPPSASGLMILNLFGTTTDLSVSYVFPSNGNVLTLISGSTLLFPDTIVNANSDVTIVIANRGSGTGTVNAISVSGSAFQPLGLPNVPLNISPGSTAQFLIRYAPKQPGTDTGSLQMKIGDDSFSATLQGAAISSSFSYELLQPSGSSAIQPGQTITLPDTKVGLKSSVDVLVRNTGTAPGSITSIIFSGTGFAITDGPQIPINLKPGDFFTVTVTFAPQQPGAATGRLRFNNDTFNLAANAIGPQLIYSYTANSATVTAVPGGNAVVFSQQNVGRTSTINFTVQNTGTAPATVISIGTAQANGTTQFGDVFTVTNLPALPVNLDPGKSLSFTVAFAPNNTGLALGNLLVDTAVFLLSGLGSAPVPLPSYTFNGASGVQAPFQQPVIGLHMNSAYSLPLKGTLILTQDAGALAPDPAVQFATGGQIVTFTIPADSTDAVFPNGLKQIRLQTGSVASTITMTPSFATQAGLDLTPVSPPTLQLTVQRAAPQLLTAAIVSKASNSFTLTLSGYTTTRSISSFQVQFTASPDVSLPSSKTTVDASGASLAWFQGSPSQAFGGQFIVSIPFNIQVSSGILVTPVDKLQTLSVTASNDVGASNAISISVQ